jgi:hypothetical protein
MKLDDTNKRNADPSLLTHEQIAAIMAERGYPMHRGRVWQIERSALRKIAKDETIRRIAQELGILPL